MGFAPPQGPAELALVGLLLPGVENHSLGALSSAAERAGFSSALVPLHGWVDVEPSIATIRRLRPRVCGISVQSTESALLSLAFVRLLRGAGYTGRIVLGGHFATLNAEEILASPAGADAVVRFAGEDALVGILRDPVPDSWAALPGVVFRDASGGVRFGAPARVRGASLVSAPRRDGGLPVHLGFPAADLVLSRGCEARCAYCCVAGAGDLARLEARRAGEPLDGPAYERRPVGEIADEIAALYHQRDARVFTIMDDNLLPQEPEQASRFVRALGSALGERAVGPIAISLQLRADAVSEELADALASLGVVRAYVGIDAGSAPMLRTIGRAAAPEAGALAIQRLSSRGILCVWNALLLGPTVAFEALHAEVDALARIHGAPVHLLPIDVRRGTRYSDRVERRGLVEGGFLFRHTRFEDPRTERVAAVITALPTRLAERSLPIALYDLAYNLGIARRLVPGADVTAATREYGRITEAWNHDQIRVLRLAMAAAIEGDAEVEALRERERPRVRAHDEALLKAADDALAAVTRAVTSALGRATRAHTRGRMLSAVAFSMGLAACEHDALPGRPAPAPLDATVRWDANVRSDAAALLDLSAIPDLAEPRDLAWTDIGTCSGDADFRDWTAADKMKAEYACDPCRHELRRVVLSFNDRGVISAITSGDGSVIPAEYERCVRELLAPYCYPSLAGRSTEIQPHCWIA